MVAVENKLFISAKLKVVEGDDGVRIFSEFFVYTTLHEKSINEIRSAFRSSTCAVVEVIDLISGLY